MITLTMERLDHAVVLKLPTDHEHVMVALWRLGLNRDPHMYTLGELNAVFSYDTPEEHQMVRLIDMNNSLHFALCSLHEMLAPPVPYAQQLRKKLQSGSYRSAKDFYLKPEFPDYDPAKAVEYLEESAAKGNAFAKYQLGKLLCQGELVPKDIARGLPLLEELAENGVTFAAYIAGKVYLREEGWQNIKKAILYFRQAAEDGNSFAEYQLGRIYYFGNGVRANQEKGLEYLKESAAHDNEYAANLLQVIHQQHTWGVASCTASLIAQLGRIFREQDQKQSQRQRPHMDRKHRREIEEKKQAMGIRD